MALLSDSLSMLLFVGGALLLVAEAAAPGAHFFVLGVALLTAGLVGLFSPVGGAVGIVLLTAAVLASTGLTLWAYRKMDLYGGEGSAQTSDSSSLTGTFGHVTERVTETSGSVKLDDGGFNPNFQARCVDGVIEEGQEVMVVDPGGGNVVTVEAVAGDDEIDRALARDQDHAGDPSAGQGDGDATSTTADSEDARDRDVESDTN